MDKNIQQKKHQFTLFDLCAVLFLIIFIFALGLGSLSGTCLWGDDFAAYILQGISIAEGSFDQQTSLNYLMHPSFMPDEASDGKLVYVWGYSLVMALVYKLVGFDRAGFSSIIYYKLPSVVALALLSAVFYLFLRRRFGFRLSFFLSLSFCMCGDFFNFFDTLYSDLFFLLFAVLALYLCELFLDASGRSRIILGVFLGITLWFMYEVRLNGVAIIFSCALAHFIWILANKKDGLSSNIRSLGVELIPYLIFFALKLVSEIVLAPATSNASDLNGTNLGIIFGNIVHYFGMIRTWYNSMWSNIVMGLINLGFTPRHNNTLYYILSFLSLASVLLCAAGILFDGIKRNFHYTVFLGVYLFVSSMLFYNQGLRYIYPMLPVLLMYSGYGFMRIVRLFPRQDRRGKFLRPLGYFLMAFLCFCMVLPQIHKNQSMLGKSGPDAGFATIEDSVMNNAYSSSAIEAYNYINAHISKDSVIGFFKPRALYLNTQCRSIALSSLVGNSLDDVDYYLIFNHMVIDPAPSENFVTIWENADFILMEKQSQ